MKDWTLGRLEAELKALGVEMYLHCGGDSWWCDLVANVDDVISATGYGDTWIEAIADALAKCLARNLT